MRGTLRVVPWTGLPEWTYVAKCVGEHVYNRGALLEALKWLRVWTLRGNTPPAVETTYSLLEIKRSILAYTEAEEEEEDEEDTESSEGHIKGMGSRCLQLALAAALVRFVNEVVDPEQQGVFALPITQLAERMNIPRMLVDLRHGATHDMLPSYEVLVLGMELALGWLRDHYWCPQAAWEKSVREATERTIERFLTASLEADPLKRPPLAVATRCLHEVPQVEVSAEVQKTFFETLIERSSHPIDKLLPLIGAVISQNDSAMIILLAVALSLPDGDQRSLSVVSYGARMIESESTLAICARDCLKKCTLTSQTLLQSILANNKAIVSSDLRELIELLMNTSTAPRTIYDISDLTSRTEKLLRDHQERLQALEQAISSEHGWHYPQDWTPRPWGVTEHFNPVTDFRSLLGSND